MKEGKEVGVVIYHFNNNINNINNILYYNIYNILYIIIYIK